MYFSRSCAATARGLSKSFQKNIIVNWKTSRDCKYQYVSHRLRLCKSGVCLLAGRNIVATQPHFNRIFYTAGLARGDKLAGSPPPGSSLPSDRKCVSIPVAVLVPYFSWFLFFTFVSFVFQCHHQLRFTGRGVGPGFEPGPCQSQSAPPS